MKNAAILHLSPLCRDSRYGFTDARYKISFKFQYR